ncbi:MAG: TetR/AcrR family transcriptional regulator [Chloroflexota bacterium]
MKTSYKEREKQRREQDILETAAQLLIERGYVNLNMDDLAETVGISKPTLYQHFKSKDELVAQIVIRNFALMEERIAESMQGTPLNCLELLMREILKSRYSELNPMNMMDHETVWKVMRSHPIIAEYRQRSSAGMHTLVEKAKAAGEIDPTLPTPIIVRSMFSLQGALMEFDGSGKKILYSQDNLDSAIEAVVRIFINGVRAKPTIQPVTESESVE